MCRSSETHFIIYQKADNVNYFVQSLPRPNVVESLEIDSSIW